MKKVMLILLLCIMMFSFASALDVHEYNQDYGLIVSSNNATQCNMSYIQYPNESFTIYNLPLDKNLNSFTTTVLGTNFTEKGVTCMGLSCTDGVTQETGSRCLEVKYLSEDIDSAGISFYLLSIVVLFVFFGLVIWATAKIPSGNYKDLDDKVIQINKLKHFRPVLWTFAWTLILSIAFIMSNMALAYIPNPMIGNFFFVIFRLMSISSIVIVPLIFIWILARWWQDRETQRLLERGIPVSV